MPDLIAVAPTVVTITEAVLFPLSRVYRWVVRVLPPPMKLVRMLMLASLLQSHSRLLFSAFSCDRDATAAHSLAANALVRSPH